MASPVADYYGAPSGQMIAGGRFAVSPFWRDLPDGWSEISVPGAKAPAGILAYSGMAVDEVGGKIYLHGGGHGDYSGNDVWELDLEDRQAWVQHYTPNSIPADYSAQSAADVLAIVDNVNFPGAIVSGGVPIRPISRHTYYSVHWIKSLAKFTVGGGSTYSGVGEWTWRDSPPWDGSDGVYYNDPRDLWMYDPVSKSWDYKGSEHLDAAYKVGMRGVYSAENNKLYTPTNNGNNQPLMWEYDIAGNAWQLTGGSAMTPMCNSWLFCMDPPRNRVLVLAYTISDGVQLWAFSLDSLTWVQLSQSGALPATSDIQEGRSLIYSPVTDRMILISSNGPLKFYEFATGLWTTETAANPPGLLQAFTTWTFDPRRGVCLLVYSSSYVVTVYAYKESV